METNTIYEGDNLEILSKFPNKSIDLIYADPPFFSNKHYEVIWKDGAEIRAFQDRWQGGIEHYTSWMEPRLRECHRVLKDSGSMYLHCDYHADAHLRILMDKIFGENNFRNEIIWHYRKWSAGWQQFQRNHDVILFYSKTNNKNRVFNKTFMDRAESTLKRFGNAKIISGFDEKTGERLPSQVSKKESEGVPMDDVWDIGRVPPIKQIFPTQKPEELLKRIIKASSKEGDLVLDPFCGCGTTLVVSEELKRKWIGIDVSPTACKVMAKRLKQAFSITPNVIKGEIDMKYVKKLNPYDFQNWVVVDKFLGNVSRTKSGDFGVDGMTSQITGGYPIQVKQSENIGRNVIDNFETALRRLNKKKGYIVAFSFGKGAYEEVARVKNQEGLVIILRTVQELIDGEVEE
ncbi:hypothetical protein FJZ53_04630 [Candidatus Woesearchaeota archaeon]|nr:hypothetical protein [Candidatus Woesearchaeota archaeon]